MKKPVHPNKRMRYEDPWVVWSACRQIHIKALMYRDRDNPETEDPNPWIKDRDIAAQIYSNWNELSEHQQTMVLLCKLSLVICFLKHHCWIEERWEMHEKPKRFESDWPEREQVYMKDYRARPGTFMSMHSCSKEWRIDSEKRGMRQMWAEFRGRPTIEELLEKSRRFLEKA